MSPAPRRRGRPALNAAGALSEDAWQRQVVGLARFYQWLTYHTHDSRRSAPGFPDLILLRPPELLVVELKPDKGSRRATAAEVAGRPEWLRHPDLTEEQATWLGAFAELAAAMPAALELLDAEQALPAVEVYLWRPRDFDVVERRLARGRGLVPSINRP